MSKTVWAPIHFHTLPGSQENFVLVLGFVSESGQTGTLNICRQSTLIAVLGVDLGRRLYSFMKMIRQSLADYLKARQSFLDWCPPFEGVRLGDYRSLESPSPKRALELMTIHFLLGSRDWEMRI